VVSKKTARLAVERHRLKRRTLAGLRALGKLPPALVVYPRASVARLSSAEIRAELGALVSRLGI
jgi:ribonuclease P protein component